MDTPPPQSVPFVHAWVPVAGGWLCIGHRPRISYIGQFTRAGGTHVLTLLSEREGAGRIGAAVERNGLRWLWFPMESAAIPGEDRIPELLTLFRKLQIALCAGGRVVIHCSAGLHRTGMVAHGLLHFLGLDGEEAMDVLVKLRPLTAKQAGDQRLAWGRRFRRALR